MIRIQNDRCVEPAAFAVEEAVECNGIGRTGPVLIENPESIFPYVIVADILGDRAARFLTILTCCSACFT